MTTPIASRIEKIDSTAAKHMPAVNWATFENLTGAAVNNFEMLCRSIIRFHYGQFGTFRALSNQPGVEFHLKLDSTCALGGPGRWFGWQCRWYGLQNGQNLGSTRRRGIEEAIEKTQAQLPEITDWILWTRHVLTKADQEWFFGLKTKMKLGLWSVAEVEEHLTGPAELLRESYFGELVLTPQNLNELHERATQPIRGRWRPQIHQVIEAERTIYKSLGKAEAWIDLEKTRVQIDRDIEAVAANLDTADETLIASIGELVKRARAASSTLSKSYDLLKDGQYESIYELAESDIAPTQHERDLSRSLRAKRQKIAPYVANAIADMQRGRNALHALCRALKQKIMSVVADAGCGKTQLAAQLTAPTSQSPAGILLRGIFLASGNNLDDLSRQITIRGKPLHSFEALISAVDVAAQRSRTRLPIIIDGLNEAEDPRGWRDQLASIAVVLDKYENVQIICTLRSAFKQEALPENIPYLQFSGFGDDLRKAIKLYFDYYKIDALDAQLPQGLLNHPLTLRIFCEVTNPDRKKPVDVTAIPSSLTVLFDRYLEQIALRIAELAPSGFRYFAADVATALYKIGLALWGENARILDTSGLRQLLNDETRPWNQSLVAALEHEDVLFREPSDQPGRGKMSIVFDALAGHIISNSLLSDFSRDKFSEWIREPGTLVKLTEAGSDSHPLARDIFCSLVGLLPCRMNGMQLWPILDGQMRVDALVQAAFLDHIHLDQDTVAELAYLIREPSPPYRDLFYRLFTTRAAHAHPLNAHFLDDVLRPMSMADRDLRWSEWLRRDETAISRDLERLAERWESGEVKTRDSLRARWAMWTLTSNNRLCRDYATRALYWLGCHDPTTLFILSLESLNINDPYVPERMLAACYGVAMNLWADPRGTKVQEALPSFAKNLFENTFAKDALYSTTHVLTRDYTLGIFALALRIDPNCIPADKQHRLNHPHSVRSPFPSVDQIRDSDLAGAEYTMGMDFENYTLGRLISGRRNYDFDNETYKAVRRQIEYRIVNLGYSRERFGKIDQAIADSSWRSERRGDAKTDRYGKKYSWIAFFEMYGLRLSTGALSPSEDRRRPSDVDIDPSFPKAPKTFQPVLADLFGKAPIEPRRWLSSGPTPDYEKLIQCEEIDGKPGPWLLLQGFIEENAPADFRQVFTFLRGVLVRRKDTAKLLDKFNTTEYPGNSAIPEPSSDYYTYAGEIPWSEHFASHLRTGPGKAKPDEHEAFASFKRGRWSGIRVEVPVYRFGWESYHSQLNQVSGTTVLAPSLCERLDLVNHHGEWDLYEKSGRPATIYRELRHPNIHLASHLLYIRADLLASYISSKLDLVWLTWGERNFHYKAHDSSMRDAFAGYTHIQRRSKVWQRHLTSETPKIRKKARAAS
jgi:hypothetical protein